MRTTTRLEDRFLRRAKPEAARSGRTLTAIIEEALRVRLSRPAGASEPRARAAEAGPGPGLCAGVDLDDSAALLEPMREAS